MQRPVAFAVAAVAFAVTGLTGCSSNPTLASAGSVSSTAHPFAVGQTARERSSGTTVTVLGFDGDVTSELVPSSNGTLAAADVKVCEGRAGGWSPDPDKFTLQVPGHDPLAQTLAAKLPALDLMGLRPGACTEGWVTFIVPQAVPAGPVSLLYRDQGSSATWRVA